MKIKEVQKWKLSEEMMHAGVAVEKIQKCHCQFDEKLKELQQEGHIIPSHDMNQTPEQIEEDQRKTENQYRCFGLCCRAY